MKKFILTITTIFSLMQAASAHVRLPNIISSNMVLQQRSSAKLWGWADAGEVIRITQSWNGKTDSVRANGNAQWKLEVQTPAAGGPFTITIRGSNTIVLKNILIGEVWICSGQSNMEMNYYWGLPQMEQDFAAAKNSSIRFFQVPRLTAATPQEHGEGSWEEADSNTVKSFSALAWYFGKKLNEILKVPVGLIHASWGGTPAETWTPAEVVMQDSVLTTAAHKLSSSNGWPIQPGLAYNGMMAPVVGYRVAGAIWYQGETNTGTAATYHQLFSKMIESWRKNWKLEFPFYFVQLAPFCYDDKNIAALLREAQTETLNVPQTGMVITTDLADDTFNIHPKDKKTVGYRLANLALTETYGIKGQEARSPLYDKMERVDDKAILYFRNSESGLISKGKLLGFMIAGTDHKFYPAEAKIVNGSSIEVHAAGVKSPLAVRYAFSNTAVGNVFSKEGLPLSPFRTDRWPADTSKEN